MKRGRVVFLSRDVMPRAPRAARAHGLAWSGALLALSILAGGVSAATPLTKPELVKLVRKSVQERRLLAVVRELGLDFKLTVEVIEELRAAGASATLLAALRDLSVPGGTTAEVGTRLPSGGPPAPVATPASAPVVAPPAAPPEPPAPSPAAASTGGFPGAAEMPAAGRGVSAGPGPYEAVPPPAPPPTAPPPKARPSTGEVLAAIPGPPPFPPPPAILAPTSPLAVPEPAGPGAGPPAVVPPPLTPGAPGAGGPPPELGDAKGSAPDVPKWEIVKPMLERAQVLAVEGDIRGAQALVAKAMEIDPGEPQVWKAFKGIELDLLARAETFLADGQVPRALREFQFVITTNPDSALGHNGVGLALLQLKNYDEAVQAFERALSLDPGNARYRQALNRARSLQRASKALEQKGQENVKEMLGVEPGRVKGP